MRPTLFFLFMFTLAASGQASGAEAESLALLGGGGENIEFNAFRQQPRSATGTAVRATPAVRTVQGVQAAPAAEPGYFAWKSHCAPVTRMAAGGTFTFGGEAGFAEVAPYVILPEPGPGFMEYLAMELTQSASPGAPRWMAGAE